MRLLLRSAATDCCWANSVRECWLMSIAKVVLALAVAIVTVGIGYLMYDSYTGSRLARELCDRDGGLRGLRRAEVRGILLTDVSLGRRCVQCLEWLVAGTYDTVDVVEGRAPTPGAGAADTRAYTRYRLAAADDVACVRVDATLTPVQRTTLRQDEVLAGVPLSQCLATERLPGRPKGFSFASYVGANVMNPRHFNVTVDVLAYIDNETGEVVSSYKNYRAYSKAALLHARVSSLPGATASCADVSQANKDQQWFKAYGLRRTPPGVHVP
jgi:hypothetical protein